MVQSIARLQRKVEAKEEEKVGAEEKAKESEERAKRLESLLREKTVKVLELESSLAKKEEQCSRMH